MQESRGSAVFVPLPPRYDPGCEPAAAARTLHGKLATRRSVRFFSDRRVSRDCVEWLVRCATTAPSGANKQPWRFVCVQDPALKREIRLAAEHEEREFYAERANDEWLRDLEPLGTDPEKPFLEAAPWLVVIFRLAAEDDGSQVYYSDISVGLAAGIFVAAAHLAGLVTLTHTPSPMRFLGEVLGRPENERPYLLVPLGYPAADCVVPEVALRRKPLERVMVVDRG